MKKTYTIEIEIELETDEEGLTSAGWSVATNLSDAIETLRNEYGWTEIKTVGNPKRKD